VSRSYLVRAVKWSEGWELHVEGEGVTQTRTLDKAVDQVRSYLETLHGGSFSEADISVTADLGPLTEEVSAARQAVRDAAAAQEAAAKKSRAIAGKLRREGLSVTDAAVVLGVSRGRVSQLVSGSH